MQSEHRDALRRVYQADSLWRREGQPPRSFKLLHTGGMQSRIDHPRWDPSWVVPTEHTIDDLAELGLLRVEPSPNKARTFVLSMKGRDSAAVLTEHVATPVLVEAGSAPSPPVVLNWLLKVGDEAPESFQVPGRLLDLAASEGLIDMSGREALARRILRLLDDGYLSGTTTRAMGETEERTLAEAWDLELTMKAHHEGSRASTDPIESGPAPIRLGEDELRDVFISHASEDKDAIARPLAESLRELGYSVWFDEFGLMVGDRLSASIDRGLATSRFGLVILSPAFLTKPWPQRELPGLVAREIGEGEALIIPVWHGVTAADVRKFSPPLADVVAVESRHGMGAVLDAISRTLARRRAQESVAERELPAADLRAEPSQSAGANPGRDEASADMARSDDLTAEGPWRPRAGGEAFVLSAPAGPLVAHLRNMGSTAYVERAELKSVLGRFGGAPDSGRRVEADDDVVLRFGDGDLGGQLQSTDPLILTVTFRHEGGAERWEQRIELLCDGSTSGGAAMWRAGEQRFRRAGGL